MQTEMCASDAVYNFTDNDFLQQTKPIGVICTNNSAETMQHLYFLTASESLALTTLQNNKTTFFSFLFSFFECTHHFSPL